MHHLITNWMSPPDEWLDDPDPVCLHGSPHVDDGRVQTVENCPAEDGNTNTLLNGGTFCFLFIFTQPLTLFSLLTYLWNDDIDGVLELFPDGLLDDGGLSEASDQEHVTDAGVAVDVPGIGGGARKDLVNVLKYGRKKKIKN